MFFTSEKFKQLDILKVITFFPRIIIASVNNAFFANVGIDNRNVRSPSSRDFFPCHCKKCPVTLWTAADIIVSLVISCTKNYPLSVLFFWNHGL